MQSLRETPKDVAERMRAIASGMNNPDDAEIIKRYADQLERESKGTATLFQFPKR